MDMNADEKPPVFGEQGLVPQADSAAPRQVYTVLTVTFLLVLLLGILLSRSGVLRSLEDFDMRLPTISVVALHPAFPAAVGLLLVLTIAKGFLARTPRASFAANTIALAVGLLLLVVYLVGVVAPFFLLVDGLS